MTTEHTKKRSFHVKFSTLEGNLIEGPLDILWNLIHSYQVDIFSVKLSKITSDFITYTENTNLNLEEKSDFATMSAHLLFYKSKQLLPNSNDIEKIEEPDRLPQDLIEQLLEYKKYQQTANLLQNLELIAQKTFTRKPSWKEYIPEDIYLDVTLNDFLFTFQDFLNQQERKPANLTLDFEEEVSLDDMIVHIRKALISDKQIDFFNFIIGFTLFKIIITFLAILELVRLKTIIIQQKEDDKTFIFLKRPT